MSKKNIQTYSIVNEWRVQVEDNFDQEDHSNDLQEAIDKATEQVAESGNPLYVLKIVKVIKPKKQPFEVTIEDHEEKQDDS